MRKITGTIIKINDDKAAIMTRDCEMIFIKKQPGMYLGLEIEFGANEIISSKKKVYVTIKIVSSVAAIFLLVFLNLHFFQNSDNYTYVCIDGEFSIEYTVDKDMKVVKATSVDKKLQEKLGNINLNSTTLQVALSDVLKNNNNFFRKGNTNSDCIIISAYTKDKSDEQRYENQNIEKVLLACKDSVDDLDDKVNYKFVGINDDARKLAEKNNISMGRYYIFEKAKEQGKDISLEQAKDMQVGELVEKVKIPYLSISKENIINDEKKPDIPDNLDNTPTVVSTERAHPAKEPKKQKKQDEKAHIRHNVEVEKKDTIGTDIKLGEEKVAHTPISPEINVEKVHPTPMPEANDKKDNHSPIVLENNVEKEHSNPVPPKANDKKEHPTPIPPNINDRKERPTPIAPKINDIKEITNTIVPKTNGIKEIPTPIAPKPNDKKEIPTPIAPKTDDKKEVSTPITPKTDDEKELSTPIAPKTNDIKEIPTPIAPKTNDIKEPPKPILPKTNDIKEPPVQP